MIEKYICTYTYVPTYLACTYPYRLYLRKKFITFNEFFSRLWTIWLRWNRNFTFYTINPYQIKLYIMLNSWKIYLKKLKVSYPHMFEHIIYSVPPCFLICFYLFILRLIYYITVHKWDYWTILYNSIHLLYNNRSVY